MPRRPNYQQDRAERQRKKAARRDERLAAKAERRERNRPSNSNLGDSTGPMAVDSAGSDTTIPADTAAIGRLGQALAFVCGTDHPATLAAQRAAQSGTADDVQRARAMFLQLTVQDQRAALAIAAATTTPG